ncbi:MULTISPECIES: acyloxyacyl hydrolase [unclassified Imperialibacter]|uniref:acyloxyacyl hydrolase n=1 Tax=unclassified Imperialibacter TaxID=2629706 RepID=UPI001256B02A|nr:MULTISPECIES: acyloxyacyl hydrolase [unclassified Imperialibacter]CAD5285107.1 hypothetical protein IMPERIA75_590033 [Imperialibacter sp. 75]CAD5296835.1 hypothetical protein IMPERIA89_690033 [Imperialibacter sp. 89]VVT24084.1 hypothetical protein IMPR6_390022 [Imperialibacter sp. EC-SDR9]
MRYTLAIIFIFNLLSNVFGQSISSIAASQSIELTGEHGAFFFNKKIPHLTNTSLSGFSLSYQKTPIPLYNWANTPKHFAFHAKLTYLDFHNKNLGKAVGLQAFLDIPIIQSGKSTFYANTGVGLLYSGSHFSIKESNLNFAIGAPLSYKINFGVGFKRHWGQRWYSRAELSFMHISNGGIRVPNLGLNSAQMAVGAGYVFSQKEKGFEAPKPGLQLVKKSHWLLQLGGGLRQPEWLLAKKYALVYLGVLRERLFFEKVYLGIGVDYFYDWATKYEVNTGIVTGNSLQYRVGIHAQQEWLFGRIGLQAGLGYHVVKQTADPDWYQKAGLKFHINDKFSVASHLIVRNFKGSYAVIWGGAYAF